ncbi:MAG: DNA/RNA non-specific endonuclease [Paludibacteraceae bacterium]|nr:DNA/RNA non-specific endonuclease [Paludibacteraceae bacterium]
MRRSLLPTVPLCALFMSACVALPADTPAGSSNDSSNGAESTDLSHAFPSMEASAEPERSRAPKEMFTHTNCKGKTYRHANYSFSYSEADEQSEWVAYELTRAEVEGDLDRKDEFAADPIVETGSADPGDYQNSGYDRGHLAPSADMRFDATAMEDCFLTSNVSPQVKGFNNGVWNDLEMQTRSWTRKYERIYVVTGPVLPKDEKAAKKMYTTKRGKDVRTNVTVPDKFYKILYDFSKRGKEKMIAFVIPNEATDTPFTEFVTTVDEVERMTGINFFSNLDKDFQERCESRSDLSKWPEATYLNYSNTHSFNH